MDFAISRDGKSWSASRCFSRLTADRRFCSSLRMHFAVSRRGSTMYSWKSPFLAADRRFRSSSLMDFAISGKRIDDAERFSGFADVQVSFFCAGFRQFHFRRECTSPFLTFRRSDDTFRRMDDSVRVYLWYFAVSRLDDSDPVYLCTSPFLATDRRVSNGSRRLSLRIDDPDRVYSWTSPFLASGSMIPNGFHDSLFFRISFFALVVFQLRGASPFLATDRRVTRGSRRLSLRIDDPDRVYSWGSPFLASGSMIPNDFHDSPFFRF